MVIDRARRERERERAYPEKGATSEESSAVTLAKEEAAPYSQQAALFKIHRSLFALTIFESPVLLCVGHAGWEWDFL